MKIEMPPSSGLVRTVRRLVVFGGLGAPWLPPNSEDSRLSYPCLYLLGANRPLHMAAPLAHIVANLAVPIVRALMPESVDPEERYTPILREYNSSTWLLHYDHSWLDSDEFQTRVLRSVIDTLGMKYKV